MKRLLDPLMIPKPAVAGVSGKGVVWIRPVIAVNVAYRGHAADGSLRHSTFKGVHED
jgi:bifunctional non-homologous end joining protein LigD